MTDYVVQGLIKRRSEIAGEIASLQVQLGERARDLETLDDALRVIAPELDLTPLAPKMFRPPEHWSKRGEMSRVVLDILRVARGSMTSRDIAAQMIVQRGLSVTPKIANIMSKRVACALRGLRDKDRVRVTSDPKAFWLEWEIAR